MVSFFKVIFNRYFRIFFALALLGFTLMVFLMNLPRAFSEEAKSPQQVLGERLSADEEQVKTLNLDGLKKLVQWQISRTPSKAGLQQTYMEYGGDRMFLKVRF